MTLRDRLSGGQLKILSMTWLACYLANYLASSQSLPVVFFSAKMSSEQLTKRFLAMHSGINAQRLIRNQIYNDEYDNLVKALGVMEINVAKNRNGATGVCKVMFEPIVGGFRNIVH